MERIASRRRLVAAGSLGTAGEVLKRLRATADPSRLGGMGRFGIDTRSALGVTVTELRGLARQIGRDHDLAAALWESEVHEARILATMVDEPSSVTEAQMERWVSDLGSWDLCDQLCGNLFDRTPFAFDKALAWSRREEEFVKRAGFALMATSAVHRKDVRDARFEVFFPAIGAQATDDRNYVKKAVSWALRQIGKRSLGLNHKAIATARRIERIDARPARWIARDVLRELESATVQDRLRRS
ncbi:MAG: DNA alkylation repair protein [Actinomycetota bacterium]